MTAAGGPAAYDTQRFVARITVAEPLASPPYCTLGLGLGPLDPDSATRPVIDVLPGTPAARLPIAAGDSIVSIAGVPAAELGPHRRRELAAEHDRVEVIRRRSGRDETMRLEVVELP